MRIRWLVVVVLLTIGVVPVMSGQQGIGKKKPFRDQFKTAQDGVTKGWLVEIPWPDQDDASQSWRTIAIRVVIARRGRVIRRIDGGVGIWNWDFWKGGQQVAFEVGPVHGETSCALIDIKTGRTVDEWPGDCRFVSEMDNVPDWVKAASGSLNAPKLP